MAVQINIEYEGNLHCKAEHGPSSERLSTDAPVDNGGKGATFSPTDLVATGLGSCLMTIMALAAKPMQLDLSGTRISVTKEMTQKPPRRIAALNVVVTFPAGLCLSPSGRVQLEQAAWACPVKQSLHPEVAVNMQFVYTA
jgi:putative redox protein